MQHAPALADGVQLAHQGVGRADLIVPISSDQQKILQLGRHQQALEQIESGGVQPLQIVKEEGERMLGPREYADEAPQDELKAPLRILRRQVRAQAAVRR